MVLGLGFDFLMDFILFFVLLVLSSLALTDLDGG